MKLEIVSTSEQPVRQIARQARQIPDPVERLRYLRGLLRMVPRNRRWGTASWPPVVIALAALAALAAVILMWRSF